MMNKYKILICLSLCAFTLTFISCKDENDTGWEFAPNMYNSLGYEPQTQILKNTINLQSSVNPSGSNMREPVSGSIARRGFQTTFLQDDSTLVEDGMFYDLTKNDLTRAETIKNPLPWSDATEEEGKVLYEKNCQHCHGEKGAGDGKVAPYYKGVPNYAADAYKNMTMGHVYHVITFGKNRMWAHGAQVTPIERWKIAHYVQRLQLGS
jgi:cytochrome c5